MKKIISIAVIVLVVVGGGVYIYLKKTSTGGNKIIETSEVTTQTTANGLLLSDGTSSAQINYVANPPESDLGVKNYPGAKLVDSKSAGEIVLNNKNLLMASYKTTDSQDKVISYFSSALKGAISASFTDSNRTYQIIKTTSSSDPVVNIYSEQGVTYFTIVKEIK